MCPQPPVMSTCVPARPRSRSKGVVSTLDISFAHSVQSLYLVCNREEFAASGCLSSIVESRVENGEVASQTGGTAS